MANCISASTAGRRAPGPARQSRGLQGAYGDGEATTGATPAGNSGYFGRLPEAAPDTT